jgi:hypothetical protein
MLKSSRSCNSYSAFKKLAKFYGTQGLITVYTRSRHCSLPWTRWIQSTYSHHVPLRSIATWSSHLQGVRPSGFPTKTFSHSCYCTDNRIPFYFVIQIIFGDDSKLQSSLLCSFLYTTTTSSLLDPYSLLSILFSIFIYVFPLHERPSFTPICNLYLTFHKLKSDLSHSFSNKWSS